MCISKKTAFLISHYFQTQTKTLTKTLYFIIRLKKTLKLSIICIYFFAVRGKGNLYFLQNTIICASNFVSIHHSPSFNTSTL